MMIERKREPNKLTISLDGVDICVIEREYPFGMWRIKPEEAWGPYPSSLADEGFTELRMAEHRVDNILPDKPCIIKKKKVVNG